MAKKGKARVRNEATSTLQDNQISNQIEEENVETNPNHSEAPSSNPSTNEVCSSAPPTKRHKKGTKINF